MNLQIPLPLPLRFDYHVHHAELLQTHLAVVVKDHCWKNGLSFYSKVNEYFVLEAQDRQESSFEM